MDLDLTCKFQIKVSPLSSIVGFPFLFFNYVMSEGLVTNYGEGGTTKREGVGGM